MYSEPATCQVSQQWTICLDYKFCVFNKITDSINESNYCAFLHIIIGTEWEKVTPPEEEPEPSRLLQVSAGQNSVWALTKHGQVITKVQFLVLYTARSPLSREGHIMCLGLSCS